MLKWLFAAALVLVGVVAVVAVIGWMLPRDHVAASSILVRAPADSLWQVVRALGEAAAWWPAVTRVERIDDQQGRELYRHHMKGSGPIPLLVTESHPPNRLVTEIATADGPFGGTWTYEIAAEGEQSRVTVTERGWIANPIFRFMANVVFGVHGTIDSYLEALARHFGEDVTPVHGE